jgi:hypothetical protein
MAKNNGFPLHIIQRIKNNLLSPNPLQITEHTPTKTWIPFTFHSPLLYVTNLFRRTPLHIAFRATNTIFSQLRQHHHATHDSSSIYDLQCATCQKIYVGQSGRSIAIRHQEHTRYICTNNPNSAYTMDILNNQHKYGPPKPTLRMLQPCCKGTFMNIWETFFIQHLHHLQLLINKQTPVHTGAHSAADGHTGWTVAHSPNLPKTQDVSSLYHPKLTLTGD